MTLSPPSVHRILLQALYADQASIIHPEIQTHSCMQAERTADFFGDRNLSLDGYPAFHTLDSLLFTYFVKIKIKYHPLFCGSTEMTPVIRPKLA